MVVRVAARMPGGLRRCLSCERRRRVTQRRSRHGTAPKISKAVAEFFVAIADPPTGAVRAGLDAATPAAISSSCRDEAAIGTAYCIRDATEVREVATEARRVELGRASITCQPLPGEFADAAPATEFAGAAIRQADRRHGSAPAMVAADWMRLKRHQVADDRADPHASGGSG